MKILVICQYYYPEPFRITDICEEWVKQGHDVHVVTGKPNYPMGKIYEGYEGKEKIDEIIHGVRVHRCFEIPRKTGRFFRFLNYYSYAFSAKKYVRKLKEKFDVIFINQLSPVMMAAPAFAYSKRHKAKSVLYCLDLWPESLVSGGIKRDGFLYKHYHKVSKKIYQKADKIAITSRLFKEYFVEQFNLSEDKITYLPQYAEQIFADGVYQKEPDGKIHLVFAGNIGKAQSVETIIRAAAEVKDLTQLYWHIVGDGSALEECKSLACELHVENVIFHGRKPLEKMPSYYQKADAMLVTLMKDGVLSLTLPGKIQTYMSAGKPILAAADGEIANTISSANCGFCASAEDFIGLADCARKFCLLSEEKRQEYGKNSKRFYEENFERTIFFERIDELFK